MDGQWPGGWTDDPETMFLPTIVGRGVKMCKYKYWEMYI